MMSVNHPSAYLNKDCVQRIREDTALAEQTGALSPAQLNLIYEREWFKALVPKVYGGLELPLPELLRLEEALSWADGSLGWVVTLCCGAGFFGGFLHPDLARTVFASPDVCLAGSGAPTGTATVSDSGFIINGGWRYASGARHATHLMANCLIKAGEHVVSNPDGKPLILPFVFDRKDVRILPAWKYTGMISTGSDAFEVTDLYVPSGRCFKISADAAVIDSPLYRYPFMQLAETTLAVNLSGMAVHFADLCGPLFEQKIVQKKLSVRQTDYLNNTLNLTLAVLERARHSFFESADRSWDALTGQSAGAFQTLLKSVSWASRALAKTALKAVDELYPYCGLEAAHQHTDINRVWRNIHTASQHALLTFPAE